MGQYTAPGLPTGIALTPSADPVGDVLAKNGARMPFAPPVEDIDDAWEAPRDAALDTAEHLDETPADASSDERDEADLHRSG